MDWIEQAVQDGSLKPTPEGLLEIARRRTLRFKLARLWLDALDVVDRGRAVVAFMLAAAAALIFPPGKCTRCDHDLVRAFAAMADHVPRWILLAAARISVLVRSGS